MKLVLLFFCVIIILALMIIFSTIKINVKKCKFSNFEGNTKTKFNKELVIYLEFYLLGIIKIARARVTKDLLIKLKIRRDVKELEREVKNIRFKHVIEVIKKLKMRLEKINLEFKIGVDSVIITSYIVAVLSTILGIVISNAEPKKQRFIVSPLYNFGNSIKINLNCIITVKVVHIIYVIYISLRKRRNKNERTSNRRSYDYSYE